MSRKPITALAGALCLAVVVADIDPLAAAGLTLEEAIATGYCDQGDTPCLEALMAADGDSSSDDKSSDDKSSDDDSAKDGDSKSDDKSSDDKSSDDKSSDDDSAKDGDSKSDDKSSDDKSSDDKSSDDKSSKDDDSKSDDKSSDDDSSKDGDSKSDDKSSDDKSSRDDDSKSDDKSSDDKSSDDKSSEDDDSSSDDDSSADTGGPLPALSATGSQVTEFNDVTIVPATVTITLSAPATGSVNVFWATEDGTATAGTDYIAASGQADFPPGSQVVVIDLGVVGDDAVESTESFFVRLSSPTGATLAVNSAEIIILDDDIDEE